MRRNWVNTFSIVGYEDEAWGVAVASRFLSVGALVPYARAGAGAVATQSLANLSYGPDGLDLMQEGLSAEGTLAKLLEGDHEKSLRQVGLVDSDGQVATFTGRDCFHWAGGLTGEGYAAQGNILTGGDVVEDMAQAFEEAEGDLGARLYAALLAGDTAGGDSRGKQSAALYVVKAGGSYGGYTDRWIDLRVDDHPEPVAELGRLLKLHRLFLGESRPEERITLPDDVDMMTIEALQAALQRAGYYEGTLSKKWDKNTQKAFIDFVNTENLEQRVNADTFAIHPAALEYILENF
jgi:uncharacterized Ntn-hydrolase superfamily protein